ncbi:MAG: hypothetical protein WKF77_29720 [Planctomycetaceae bacterium]
MRNETTLSRKDPDHAPQLLTHGVSSIDFSSVSLSSPAQVRTFTICNVGNANLTLQSPTLPAGMALTAPFATTTLAPNGFLNFSVRIGTTAARLIDGEIVIPNNDANERPFNIRVRGAVYSTAPRITGELFDDGNLNKIRDQGERILANLAEFADLNGNVRFDSGEPQVVTDAQGHFQIPLARTGYVNVIPLAALAGETPTVTARGSVTDARSAARTEVRLPFSITTRPNENPPVPENADSIERQAEFVPPDGRCISFSAFVITESRGFRLHGVTRSLNGIITVSGFLRMTAALTSAATSMHRAAVVEPVRCPVTGDRIDPEMSGNTNTSASKPGERTDSTAHSHAGMSFM